MMKKKTQKDEGTLRVTTRVKFYKSSKKKTNGGKEVKRGGNALGAGDRKKAEAY